MEYKQVIIVRKDLQKVGEEQKGPMSPGKLAVQVAHASMAFLRQALAETDGINTISYYTLGYRKEGPEGQHVYDRWGYRLTICLDKGTYDDWLQDAVTKVVCEAKTKNQLLKVIDLAKEMGLEENKDYFLIKDQCRTDIVPEEFDDNGAGRTLTCIGFRPLPEDIADKISHRYHLYV